MLAVNGALAGRSVGVFCPTYKFLGPLFEPIVSALRGLSGVRVNRMLGEIRLLGGGAIDFWSLDYTARAGRGRRYHLALIDESAHDEGRLADSFPASIDLLPTFRLVPVRKECARMRSKALPAPRNLSHRWELNDSA